MRFKHGQWAAVTEICACHCKHHPAQHKVIHYFSLHADTSGNVAGGLLNGLHAGRLGGKLLLTLKNTIFFGCDVKKCHGVGHAATEWL